MSNKDYIELNAFIKLKNIATSGGQAKQIIRSGDVLVNNIVETRNKKKLFEGDIVQANENKFVVKKENIK